MIYSVTRTIAMLTDRTKRADTARGQGAVAHLHWRRSDYTGSHPPLVQPRRPWHQAANLK